MQITDATANGGTNRNSTFPNADLDASRVVFVSDADLLSEGRADNDFEIWLWDEITGLQRLTDTHANAGTGRDFFDCVISADGTRVVFRGDGDLLSEGRADNVEEIWMWDEVGGLQRITDAAANMGTARDSLEPVLTTGGTRIAFFSDADLLSEGRADNDNEIWLWDEVTGFQRLTDGLTNGATGRDSSFPAISADGSRLCFRSDADLLSEGRATNDAEIWLWDEVTGLQRLTDTHANGGTDRDFYYCAISADGTRVVFDGDGDLLSEGRADNNVEIWLWDEALGLQRLTDVTMNGCGNQCDATDPEISGDGVLISFESDADLLGAGNPGDVFEIWVYDQATASLTQVTTASAGDRDSESADISVDGAYIAFMSDSDFLAMGNPVGQDEIWLIADPVPIELVTFTVE